LALGQVAAQVGFDSVTGPPHYLKSALAKKKVEVLFYPMLPQFLKEHFFLEGSQALPVCLSGKCDMSMKIIIDY
jgi:hypothetical protein